MEANSGELLRPVGFQAVAGYIDNEFAKIDHTHDIEASLYAKLARSSDGNMIDNPELWYSQRGFPTGTSATVCPADRWSLQSAGAVAASLSSITSTPTAPNISHAGRITVTTIDSSIAAGDYLTIQQSIEGYVFGEANFGSTRAQTLTLSFWARSSVAGVYCVALRNNATNRSFIREYALEANTWKLVVLSFPGCTDGTWEINQTRSAIFTWSLSCGSTFHASPGTWNTTNTFATSNQANFSGTLSATFDLTAVKLEIGNYSPYTKRPVHQELLNCKRYFQRYLDPPLRGVVTAGTTMARCGMILPVEMRQAPTLIATGSTFIYDGTAGAAINSIAASYMDSRRVEHDVATAVGGFTVGRAAVVYWNGGTGIWDYSAEIL